MGSFFVVIGNPIQLNVRLLTFNLLSFDQFLTKLKLHIYNLEIEKSNNN